jgi:hypothetical protein
MYLFNISSIIVNLPNQYDGTLDNDKEVTG